MSPLSRRKRNFIAVLLVLLAFAAGVGTMLWLHWHSAPEAARMLPEGDAILYVNCTPVRLASIFTSLPKPHYDAEYEDFVQGTGFDFERDLKEVALAAHFPEQASQQHDGGATQPGETRYSVILIGDFKLPQAQEYIRKLAKSTESYRNTEIFVVPVEGRTVRLALLNYETVAVSNVEDPQVIRGMIDRSHEMTVPLSEPSLVKEYYKDVPFGSLAWAVAKPQHDLPLPSGLSVPLPASTVWVGSLRYEGNLELKAQAIAGSQQDAQHIYETLNALLQLAHSLEQSSPTQGADPDVKKFFDGIQVKQEKTRAVVTASISPGFIRKILSEPRAAVAPEAEPTQQSPTEGAGKKKKNK